MAYVAAMLGVLALATIVRVPPLTSGSPYTTYVDEGHVLRPTLHMLAHRTHDPGIYQYPQLLMSTIAATGIALDTVSGDDLAAEARRADSTDYYDDVEPTVLVLVGRVIVLLFGLGTVVLTMVLGTRLLGRLGGVLAGLVVACLPALVTRSAIVIVDTPATFFVLAALLVGLHLDTERRRLAWAVLAGACCGAAFASKYPSGAVGAALLVMIALQRGRSVRQRAAQAAVVAVTAAVTAVVLMPSLVRKPRAVTDDIQGAADIYEQKSTATGYLQELLNRREVGLVVVLFALVGVVQLLRSPKSRALTIGWLTFAIIEVGSLLWTDFQPFRNVLPVVPFLGIAAVAGILTGARWANRVLPGSRDLSAPLAVGLTVAVCANAFVWGALPTLRRQTGIVDTRRSAREWLASTADEGSQTLVVEDLAILPSELGKVPGEVTVVGADSPDAIDLRAIDYVVVGRFEGGAAAGPDLRREPGWRLVQEWGREPTRPPSLHQARNQYIAIYERSS